jgi:LuxR family maltose regulon positive regulatory protein
MMVKTCEVELALRQNNIEKALKISKGINFEVYPPVFYFFIPQLTYIKLLLSMDDMISTDEAADRLEKLIEFGRTTFRQNLLIQALPLQSLICIRKGDEEKANKLIEEALTIAEPGGFIRTFLDLGKPMEKLLMSVYKTNPDNIYLNRILREFKKEKQNISPQVIIDKKTGLSENLSAREIELLYLVAKGLRNSEIADKLNLSTISIKKYLSNIYLKLDVGNRVLALSKARELGLISTI